jgi:hypothetical protein
MRHEITHGEFAGHVRIVQLEPRKELGDGIVPRELALVGEDRERGRGERLGVGGDLKQRVGVHACRIAQGAHAVAFGEHHTAVLDDGDGGARRAQRLEPAGDVCVELFGAELGPDGARGERQHRCDEANSHSPMETRSTTLRPGSSANSL